MEEPQDGVVYPLVLGNTFLENSVEQFYHTLQYTFKPASIDTKKSSGVLRKNERGGLEVEIANKTATKNGMNEKVLFKGNYIPCKEIECILVFDKSANSFRLERLAGSGKALKAVRDDPKAPKPLLVSSEQDTETDLQLPPSVPPSSSSLTSTTARKRRSPVAVGGDFLDESLFLKKSKTVSPKQGKKDRTKSFFLKDSPTMVDEVIDMNINGAAGKKDNEDSGSMSDVALLGFLEEFENDMITDNSNNPSVQASAKHLPLSHNVPPGNHKQQQPPKQPQVGSSSTTQAPSQSESESGSDSESASESDSESSSSDSGSSSASDSASDNEKKKV